MPCWSASTSEWRERDEPRSARALWGLAWVEFWAGRWELAAAHAARAHDISSQYGLEVPQDHLPIAVIAVHRGQLELAREHSERASSWLRRAVRLHPPQHVAVLGLVALWSGDASAAAECSARPTGRLRRWVGASRASRWWTADHAEPLLELGRIDDAVESSTSGRADAARLGREWVLAHVTRCRGLVAAARGSVDQAASLLEQAVAQHEDVGDPFGRARALLALGAVRRRARQKRAARDAIAAALAGFEELGAAPGSRRRAPSSDGSAGARARKG